MPTIFDGISVKEGFELAFNQDIETIKLDQLWWLVRFAKHIRGNCKNNKQFNEYMNRNFPSANFREVDKIDGDLFPYKGLQIKLLEISSEKLSHKLDEIYGKELMRRIKEEDYAERL